MKKKSETKPVVLLVDDYPDAREMYAEYLEFSGFHIVQAGNGVEAIERAHDSQPDVILMDLSLPIMDGWEATRRIKANPKTKDIIVVALTGHAEPSHAKRALDAGCDDFLAKPCLPDQLVAKIREYVELDSKKTPKGRK